MQLIDAMYFDVPHVKISNYVATSVFLKVCTVVALSLFDVAQHTQSTDDIGLLDQTIPLDENK